MRRYLYFLFVFLVVLLDYTTTAKAANSSTGGVSASFLRMEPTTIPSVCRFGDVRFSSTDMTLHLCTATNTWGVVSTLTAPIGIGSGGTGQTTKQAGFNALSPLGTKGDLLGFDGTNNVAVGVGANGTVLTADSTQATGWKWASTLTDPTTTLGDTIYRGVSALTALSGNTTTTKKFMTQTGTGSASAAPAWATIVGSDLPNPSATTLGGVESAASVTHQWINAISTLGVPTLSQPAFTDISGSVAASQLPNPSATTLGGIESILPATHEWVSSISTLGVPSLTQPDFSDLSGAASLTTQVVGTLPVANGGTGVATLSSGYAIIGNGTSAVTQVAPGTNGNVLTSNGTSWVSQSVSAVGGTNAQREYISNGGAETNTTGWATYADAAGPQPVDGTGGSPTVTLARTTSTILVQTASFDFTKGAANDQGQGTSYDFTVDPADYSAGQPVFLSFKYQTSAAYASGDMYAYVYDKDGSKLLTILDANNLSGEILASSSPTTWTGVFYPNASDSHYRLIFHVASTNASAYDFYFDAVHAGSMDSVPGAIVTPLMAYTPTFTGFGTVTGVNFYSRRIGDMLYVHGTFTAGTTTATTAQITLGYSGGNANVTIDSSKVFANTVVGGPIIFNATAGPVAVPLATGANNFIEFGIQSATLSGLSPVNGSTIIASGNQMSLTAMVPISGWNASAALSTSDTLLSAVKVIGSLSQTVNNTTPSLSFTTSDDVFATYSGSTFTAPKTSYYDFSGYLRSSSVAWTAGNAIEIYYSLNGGAAQIIGRNNMAAFTGIAQSPYHVLLKMNKGDTLVLKAYSDQSSTFAGTLNIQEKPDFSVFSQYNTIDRKYDCTASGPAGWATSYCYAIPRLSADGTWWLKFWYAGTLTSSATPTVAISGATFSGVGRFAVSCNDDAGGSSPSNCFCNGSSGVTTNMKSATTGIDVSGDCPLASKPTFVP